MEESGEESGETHSPAPADGAGSQQESAFLAEHETPTIPFGTPIGGITPLPPSPPSHGPNQSRRRWRTVLIAVCIVVLVASIATSVSIVSGHVGNLFAFTGPAATATLAPTTTATATATLAPTATATPLPKPTATPGPVGEGVGSGGGSYPPYTGPISSGQGCPSGKAPKPVSWAIHSASDYGAPRANVVALTFDDGPTPYYTPSILSYLEKTHTPATFFVMGQYAQAYPYLIQREAADGFAIGVHTWNHPSMPTLSVAQRAWQFAATVQQLHADLGANVCIWLWRPPYGDINSAIVAQAGTYGLTTIIWNDDPADWSQPGTNTIVNRVLSQVRPGSIILMHDGPAGRAETLAALPAILAGLHQRGLTPVTLPQLLLGYKPPKAGPTPTTGSTPTPSPMPSPVPTETPTPIDVPSPTPSPTA